MFREQRSQEINGIISYISGSISTLLFFFFFFFFEIATHELLVAVLPVPERAAGAAGFVHDVSPRALYQYFLFETLSIVTCHTDDPPAFAAFA